MIAPRAGERLAGFPVDVLSLEILLQVVGRNLFRRIEIALAGQVEPVVDQDIRLKLVGQFPKPFGIPIVMAFPKLAGKEKSNQMMLISP